MVTVLEWFVNGVFALVGIAVAVGIVAFAVAAVQHRRKRRIVAEALSKASPEQVSRIISLVESIGTEPPVGGLLVGTGEQQSGQTSISIPECIHDFPWAGQTVFLSFDPDPVFSLSEGSTDCTHTGGRVYRYVPVPRIKTKSGKLRNVFSLPRFVDLNSELLPALADICEKHPMETLSAILWNGELDPPEPVDQLRIGTSAAWMQEPEWQYCGKCRKRMRLIVQVPGPCTGEKRLQESTLYLFGCNDHPNETKSVAQFS